MSLRIRRPSIRSGPPSPRRPRTTVGVALALAVSAVGAGAVVASPAQAATSTTLTGVTRVLAVDSVLGAKRVSPAPRTLQLVVGSRTYRLAGALPPADHTVQVTGTLAGSTLTVTSSRDSGVAKAAAAFAPTGTSKTLLMLASWTAPDTVTPASATAAFGDASTWFRDVSYGAFGLGTTVTPWLGITGPAGGQCYGDSGSIMSQAKAAATAQGYDLAAYTNYVVYFPWAGSAAGSDCSGYAGWASVGGTDLWLNGYIGRREITHELGHNLGLNHSNSLLCSAVITGTCTFAEYGDDWDAMGASGNVAHFNASQKQKLGWMGTQLVTATNAGQTTLLPFAADQVGPKAVKVDAGGGRSYWLEYRRPIDGDSALPASATDGVLLHVAGTGSGASYDSSSLLDARPADGLATTSATLRSGASWTSPEGVIVRIGAVSTAGAVVNVSRLPVIAVQFTIRDTDVKGERYLARITTFDQPAATLQVQYGLTTSYGTATPVATFAAPADSTGQRAAVVTADMPNLTPGKVYHYRTVVRTGSGTVTGADRTFIASAPPRIETAGSVTGSATGIRRVISLATTWGDLTDTFWISYGTTTAYGSTTASKTFTATPDASGIYSAIAYDDIKGLTKGVTYHYVVTHQTAAGTTTSGDLTLVAN